MLPDSLKEIVEINDSKSCWILEKPEKKETRISLIEMLLAEKWHYHGEIWILDAIQDKSDWRNKYKEASESLLAKIGPYRKVNQNIQRVQISINILQWS